MLVYPKEKAVWLFFPPCGGENMSQANFLPTALLGTKQVTKTLWMLLSAKNVSKRLYA